MMLYKFFSLIVYLLAALAIVWIVRRQHGHDYSQSYDYDRIILRHAEGRR